MKITFLGQGFEAISKDSIGNYLIKFFSDKDFHSFYGISAFTSLSGIKGLAKHIVSAKHLNNKTIVTGIDQKGTSKEALEALMSMNINSYIFYQPSVTIFHPKIYLFEGNNRSELIIGSSNLTSQGLFTNVETSLLISIDNSLADDRKMIRNLKKYFKGIFDYSDPNLKPLTSKLIADLVKAKIVPTEAERKLLQDKGEKGDRKVIENIISKIFPKRAIAQIPNDFKTSKKLQNKLTAKVGVSTKVESFKLLWESGPLTERDLNIPKGSTTNPTGSMLFKKGRTENIDQRHYFRDTVFSYLNWVLDNRVGPKHLEKAAALFRIIVMGKDYGSFALTLTHNPRTDTRSYNQRNSMTSISWGDAKSIIAKGELIGKSAKLYGSPNKMGEFTLVID